MLKFRLFIINTFYNNLSIIGIHPRQHFQQAGFCVTLDIYFIEFEPMILTDHTETSKSFTLAKTETAALASLLLLVDKAFKPEERALKNERI